MSDRRRFPRLRALLRLTEMVFPERYEQERDRLRGETFAALAQAEREVIEMTSKHREFWSMLAEATKAERYLGPERRVSCRCSACKARTDEWRRRNLVVVS